MAETNTLESGLNLDWLNVDTEQGITFDAGRNGLTLQNINALSYGVDDRDEARDPSWAPRGSQPDARSPRGSVQYTSKSDVWTESCMLLYEEAVQRQWSSTRDIPWDTIKPLPDDLERAMCTLGTFLTQVEFIAGDVPGRFLEQVHPDYFESQLFLGTQVMDEARHLDVFRKRILANGGGMSGAGLGAVQLLQTDDFTEMTALLHLFGEGLVQTLFRMGELIAQNEAEKRIFRLSAQDESRHNRQLNAFENRVSSARRQSQYADQNRTSPDIIHRSIQLITRACDPGGEVAQHAAVETDPGAHRRGNEYEQPQ